MTDVTHVAIGPVHSLRPTSDRARTWMRDNLHPDSCPQTANTRSKRILPTRSGGKILNAGFSVLNRGDEGEIELFFMR